MVKKLLEYMESEKLTGFYVSRPENVKYISGYTGDDSFLFITKNKYYFITDPRYMEQATEECPDYEIINWRLPGNTMADTINQLVKMNQVNTVAFESDHVNYNTYKLLKESVKTELIPVEGVIEKFRSNKSPYEIEQSRISCEIASRAFEKILEDIRVGITEKELASKLSHYMVMEGSDTKPYGNILISGARTSLLHGIPSSKSIEYGDLVLMDYGCGFNGYLSDMTRTVIVGKASAKQREIYELEYKMVEACLSIIKGGVSAKDVYYASTEVIKNTEYFKYHYSGIGHGVGMFVHEMPFMGPNSNHTLEVNNIITVEPGIYIPGWGGIRIEDQILVTKDGYENLISASKELIEI